jgi:GT2 family glycosyltransferase
VTAERPEGGPGGSTRGQPRVRGNDWPSLRPPAQGGWTPTRTVTVVVPAHRAESTLPATLASLAAQTYPAELLEVVVVDDGSTPPLTLPELRPERTRLVPTASSWGRGAACHTGALAAEGEVLHWLDADMLLHADEVEAQLRWHHLIDYAVVLGTKTFVDVVDGLPSPAEVVEELRAGRAADLFAGRWTAPHEWVEEHLERTAGLTRNPTASYLVHVGASASVRRDLYLATGGMDPELKLGEDVELGYRLAQQGAVFVPDAEARSWHLGRSTLMRSQDEVNRYNRPFVTDRVPDLRHWRTRGRSYTVPWVEAVVEVDGRSFDAVRHSVTGVLTSSLGDVTVVLRGPWSRLTDARRSPLRDPDRDLRMLQAEYAGEHRVRLVEELAPTAFPATYRLQLPAGWTPGPDTVRRLARETARKDRGLVSLVLPDGEVARLERTSAFARAARLVSPLPDPAAIASLETPAGPQSNRGRSALDEVVDEISGGWWFDGVEEGFRHVADQPIPTTGTTTGSATGPAAGPTTGPTSAGAPAGPDDAAEQPVTRLAGLLGRARRRGR